MGNLDPDKEQSGPAVTTPPPPPTETFQLPPTGDRRTFAGVLGDPGLRGKARFDKLMQTQATALGMWSSGFNKWLALEPEDPSDPEYNAALQAAKWQAQVEEDEAKARGLPSGPASISGPFRKPPAPSGAPQDFGPGQISGPFTPPGQPVTGPDEGEEFRETRRKGNKHQDSFTRFKGSVGDAVSSSDLGMLLGPEALSPTQQQYVSTYGTTLNGPKEEYAKRSGAFVYMGTETGQSGASHDVYVYYKDAAAGVFSIPADQMKLYQKRTGLDQSGYPQDELQDQWDKAVSEAQGYAKAGIKISVRELFDRRIARVEAAMKARGGGGGGGGGSSFIGENPPEVAAIDYYRSMMQILGDISGVPTPGGRG